MKWYLKEGIKKKEDWSRFPNENLWFLFWLLIDRKKFTVYSLHLHTHTYASRYRRFLLTHTQSTETKKNWKYEEKYKTIVWFMRCQADRKKWGAARRQKKTHQQKLKANDSYSTRFPYETFKSKKNLFLLGKYLRG